jgi:dihydrofolate reductase
MTAAPARSWIARRPSTLTNEMQNERERGEAVHDPKPQIPAGKVHWAFMMSLDGFVAGPGHTMDFMERTTTREGLLQEYIEATGAVLAGRDGYDSAVGVHPYGGAWQGPIFVLTHHPEDARPREDVTFLDCPVEEAVRIGLTAARGKKLQVHSPNIGRQLLALGLIDEIDIHIAPVLLGDGVRLYNVPGGEILHLQRDGDDPALAANLRYRPIRASDE